MKNSKVKFLAMGVAAIIILTSVAAFADGRFRGFGKFAENAESISEMTDEQKSEFKAKRLAELKEDLDKQVEQGEITQEQADKIYEQHESNDFQKPAQIFTDDEKIVIREKMKACMKEILDAKVAAGTITQEQADAILERADGCGFGEGKAGMRTAPMEGRMRRMRSGGVKTDTTEE